MLVLLIAMVGVVVAVLLVLLGIARWVKAATK